DTRVSMVEAPWRAALTAPRWKGQPPQNVMGNDSAMATQPQCGNWKTVNMEMKNSGMVRMADQISRGFSSATPGASSILGSSTSSSALLLSGWSTSSPSLTASSPAFDTASMSMRSSSPAGTWTYASLSSRVTAAAS